MQFAIRLPSIINANKILSYPGLSRVKQPIQKVLRTRQISTQPLKNMADQPNATIMRVDRLPSGETGFFKMTTQSIGGILFENKSSDGSISYIRIQSGWQGRSVLRDAFCLKCNKMLDTGCSKAVVFYLLIQLN